MLKDTSQDRWYCTLLGHIKAELQGDAKWTHVVESMESADSDIGIHLAVFVEPYLQYILEGKKTVESRFGVTRRVPYERVREGDVVLLKKSGGAVYGICELGQVWSYRLDPTSWKEIKECFSAVLCLSEDTFWKEKEKASFATLMRIRNTRAFKPISITKRDRRGWVLIKEPGSQTKTLFT